MCVSANSAKEKLDAIEKNLTDLGKMLSDDDKAFTYGKIKEALHKLHGVTEILLWEKKADGTRVPREGEDIIIQCKPFYLPIHLYSLTCIIVLIFSPLQCSCWH